ncbi:hypothetical protein [Paenibacillus marinisediminis]
MVNIELCGRQIVSFEKGANKKNSNKLLEFDIPSTLTNRIDSMLQFL